MYKCYIRQLTHESKKRKKLKVSFEFQAMVALFNIQEQETGAFIVFIQYRNYVVKFQQKIAS